MVGKMETAEPGPWDLAKGSFWGMAGSLFCSLISFFYAIFIARAFPPDSVGLFYLGLSVITGLAVVTDFGVSVAVSRYTPFFVGRGEPEKIRQLVKLGLLSNLLSGALFTLLLFWQADLLVPIYHSAELVIVVRLLAPLLLLNNLVSVCTSYLKGRTDMKFVAIAQNVQNGSKLLLTFALFYCLGASVTLLCLALVASVAIAFCLLYLRVRSSVAKLPKPASPLELKALFLDMLPLCFTCAAMGWTSIIFSSSAQLLLAYFTDPAVLGATIAVYAMASNLGAVLQIIPNAISAIALPTIARFYGQGNMGKVADSATLAQRWAMLLLFPAAAVLAVFSDHALSFLFGEAYGRGAFALSAIVLSILLQAVFQLALLAFIAKMEMRLLFSFMILGGCLGIFFSLLFVPGLGLDGAALSALASILVLLPLVHHISTKRLGFGIPKDLVRIFIAGAALFLLLLPVKMTIGPAAVSVHSMLLSMAASGIVSPFFFLAYFSCLGLISATLFIPLCILLRCFTRDDSIALASLLGKMNAPRAVLAASERLLEMGMPR